MKTRVIWMIFCGVWILGASAQTIPFEYVTEFSTPAELGQPIAIAVDSSGGVYYTLLASSNPDTSGCYYVANPLKAPAPDQHVLVDDGFAVNVPVGRGFTGVDVDSAGNVFLAMDSGANETSSITKRGPAPTFEWVDDFGGMAMVFGQRYCGVAVLNEDLIAVNTFTSVQFMDAKTGDILHEVTGGEAYQRDIAYNPTTYELYISKNGSELNHAANRLSGGSPDNLAGYAEIQSAFIPRGGVGGVYGIKNQLLAYDPVNDLILIPDASTSPSTVAVYRPNDITAPVANLHGYQSPKGPLFLPADIATWTNESGDTYVFVTDSSAYRIMVFKMGGEGENSSGGDSDLQHPFTYVTDFTTVADTGAPFALGADMEGGLYYTLFSTPNPNTTGCYYIADPLNAHGVEHHVLVEDGADTDVPANRGFLGVAVDDEGAVYLALETGQAATANLRKILPAPGFGVDASFGGGIVYYNKRMNGVEYVGGGMIAVSTFNTVEFISSADGASVLEVSGGKNYQRDLAFNPTTGDFYLARNSQIAGETLGSVNLLTGGSVDNLAGYGVIQNHFIPQGGIGGTYGANNQLIEYDAVNNHILVPDYAGTQPTMAFYDPANPNEAIARIDGSESENGPFVSPTDAVAIHTAQGETYVYISDMGGRRIYVYQTRGVTGVSEWELF